MYKLTYFDTQGRAEPARLIFSAAGVKFIDNRIQKQDWPAVKEKIGGGQLPLLEVDDKKLFESKTIYRYLARKFKLIGEDEWQTAKADEIVDAINDVIEEYVELSRKETDPVRKEEKKSIYSTTTLPNLLGRLNKIQKENGGTWLVGKSMTWADIVTAEFIRQLLEVGGDPKIMDAFPLVKQVHDAVFSNQNIKAYRGK